MSGKIVVFDLPCKGNRGGWSPNVWKTRLVLNYKKMPYQTEWIIHQDIPAKFESLGVTPNGPEARSRYTVPMVGLPDGSYVMDSINIAPKLEQLQPEPSLHLDTGLHVEAQSIVNKCAASLLPVFMPRIGRDVVVEVTYDWFQRERSKMFGGMPLDEVERTKGGEPAWKAAEPAFQELKTFLASHKKDEGPFILGSQVSYGDFLIASMMESLRRIGQDLYDRFAGYDESFRRLHEACKPWFEKDS